MICSGACDCFVCEMTLLFLRLCPRLMWREIQAHVSSPAPFAQKGKWQGVVSLCSLMKACTHSLIMNLCPMLLALVTCGPLYHFCSLNQGQFRSCTLRFASNEQEFDVCATFPAGAGKFGAKKLTSCFPFFCLYRLTGNCRQVVKCLIYTSWTHSTILFIYWIKMFNYFQSRTAK